MARYERLLKLLTDGLKPSHMQLTDDSASHAGHASEHGDVTGHGETHFNLVLSSSLFEGLSRIERQQKVNFLLAYEFKNGLHAFQMKLFSLDEWKKLTS